MDTELRFRSSGLCYIILRMNGRLMERNSASRYLDLGESHKSCSPVDWLLYKFPIHGYELVFLQEIRFHLTLEVDLVFFSKVFFEGEVAGHD